MKESTQQPKCFMPFESQLLTLKSVYRKKLPDENYNVYLRFYETNKRYILMMNNLEAVKDFRRGDKITLHIGNGGYFAIEKRNTVPQD